MLSPKNGDGGDKPAGMGQATGERVKEASPGAGGLRATSPRSPMDTGSRWFKFGKSWLSRSAKDGVRMPYYNPELLTNQKREWAYLQKATAMNKMMDMPTSLFEHFVVVGLHPEGADEAAEVALRGRRSSAGGATGAEDRDGGQATPGLEPQVLFKYPPAKRLTLKGLPAFCFPNGVRPRLMARTPSMSEFHELVYGQAHMKQDDQSFVFLLKVANNVTLYGVCMLVQEIVQRPPGILAMHTTSAPPPLSTCLVSAPRCYCFLTQLPFFQLHFEVLSSILAQERLDRIKQHIDEMDRLAALVDPHEDDEDIWKDGPSTPCSKYKQEDELLGILRYQDEPPGTMRSRRSTSINAAATVTVGEKEVTGAREGGGNLRGDEGKFGESSLWSEQQGVREEGGDDDSSTQQQDGNLSSVSSDSESIHSDDSEDELVEDFDVADDFGVAAAKAWVEAKNNDSLRILCAYHSMEIPLHGSKLVFQPLPHLQPIAFTRQPAAPVAPKGQPTEEGQAAKCPSVNERLPAAMLSVEEAQLMAPWAVATVCRALSLENILTMLQAALLEKQILVICPNLGILSAVVISLVPMLRPFVWQSVLLPVLPADLFAFLDAPVPFIVGVQHKTPNVRLRAANLIRINVYKNKVKLQGPLPPLPHSSQLLQSLQSIHASLAAQPDAEKRPVHRTTEEQASLVENFLAALRTYTESLYENLQLHSITDVRPGGDRVSLLLKDSFLAAHTLKDRPFVKLFCETQLFAAHSDAVLSGSEVY